MIHVPYHEKLQAQRLLNLGLPCTHVAAAAIAADWQMEAYRRGEAASDTAEYTNTRCDEGMARLDDCETELTAARDAAAELRAYCQDAQRLDRRTLADKLERITKTLDAADEYRSAAWCSLENAKFDPVDITG